MQLDHDNQNKLSISLLNALRSQHLKEKESRFSDKGL